MNSNLKAILGILVLVAALVAIFAIVSLADQDDDSATASPTPVSSPTVVAEVTEQQTEEDQSSLVEQPTEQPTEEPMVAGITADEVAMHAVESDCWTIIEGDVYDITAYIPRHPGGGNILDACGTDGSALFRGQEVSSQGEQNNHSSRAEAALDGFLLDTLAQ